MSQKSPIKLPDGQNNISLLKEIINNQRCIEDTLEELQVFLSDSSISNVPLNIVNESIFEVALSYLEKNFFEITKSISERLENVVFEDYRNACNTLIKLLGCWDLCLKLISEYSEIRIVDLSNFIRSFFKVFIETQALCKTWAKSKSLIENKSSLLTSFLTSLFHQCISTLNLFYEFLDSEISFNGNEESEMEILLEILNYLSTLAILAEDADLKTLMDTWKEFGKLATTYADELKNHSSDTVTQHFKALAKSIGSIVSHVKDESASDERTLFCSRMLLMILEKLCGAFCNCIKDDVIREIIFMIVNLFAFTEQNMISNGYKYEFIKFVTCNFTFYIEYFLNVIFENNNFKGILYECGKNLHISAINYHILLLTLVKKISGSANEEQQEWFKKEQSIIEACFQNIDKLTADICVGKLVIRVSDDIAQGSYNANIYEATFINICTLVCQITNSDFTDLIMLLLKYLLSGNFFSSLLSSDIWCFICRLGSSEMCYEHFNYLMQIYKMLNERKNSMNVVMLYNLIGRQFNFLMDTDKLNCINNLTKSTDPHVWSTVTRLMDTQEKKQFQRKLNVFVIYDRIIEHLKNLEDQPSLNNFHALMKDFAIIETNDLPQDDRLCDVSVKLLNKFVNILSDCDSMVLLLSEDFITLLLRMINPRQKQVEYLTSVLELMIMMYPYASSTLRLEFSQAFNKFAVNLSDSHKIIVADLMYCMLSDDDPSVQQQAFEAFEQLTLATESMEILSSIALAVRNGRSDLSVALSEFIAGHVPEDIDIDDFFGRLSTCEADFSKHICYKRNRINCEKIPKLSEPDDTKPSSQDEYLDKQADKLCTDIQLMIQSKRQLKRDTYERLRRVCLDFLKSDQ